MSKLDPSPVIPSTRIGTNADSPVHPGIAESIVSDGADDAGSPQSVIAEVVVHPTAVMSRRIKLVRSSGSVGSGSGPSPSPSIVVKCPAVAQRLR